MPAWPGMRPRLAGRRPQSNCFLRSGSGAPRWPRRRLKQCLKFRHKLVAQRGRCLGAEDWFGGFGVHFCAATARNLVGPVALTAVEPAVLVAAGFSAPDPSGHRCVQIGRIEIVFPGNPDQGE